jgi:23S rRNA (guanosine2251-2'-O)-methyltransferase
MTFDKNSRLQPEDYSSAEHLPVRLVIEDVRSGNNVGSFFRTGDAFRISGLELCGITCHPPHRDILKTALGSSKYVPWRAHHTSIEAIQILRSEGYKIASVEQHESSILLSDWKPEPGEKWAFIFGNEVRGVRESTCVESDLVIEIPQLGVKQSMNVSVCAGVVLWQTSQLLG